MSWVNLSALGKIVLLSLFAGAGLPALFAAGLLALSKGPRAQADPTVLCGGSTWGIIAAAICFLIVLTAVSWSLYEIYQVGHPPHAH